MKKMLSVICSVAIVAMSSAAFAAAGAGDNTPGSGVYGSVHDLTNGPNMIGAPSAPRVPGFQPDLRKARLRPAPPASPAIQLLRLSGLSNKTATPHPP